MWLLLLLQKYKHRISQKYEQIIIFPFFFSPCCWQTFFCVTFLQCLLKNQNIYYHGKEKLPVKHGSSPPKARLQRLCHTSPPTCTSSFCYKEKSLGCHPDAQCRANCLHLPLFLPASEGLRSYLFMFSHPPSHAARPAHCHSAHPFFPKRKDAVEGLGDRDFPHTSRLFRKPCWHLRGEEVKTPNCLATGQDKEPVSTRENRYVFPFPHTMYRETGADEPTVEFTLYWRHGGNAVFSNISKRSSLITCIAPERISGPALRTIHTFDFLSRAWVLGPAERKLVKSAVQVNTSNPACVIYLTNRGKTHK